MPAGVGLSWSYHALNWAFSNWNWALSSKLISQVTSEWKVLRMAIEKCQCRQPEGDHRMKGLELTVSDLAWLYGNLLPKKPSNAVVLCMANNKSLTSISVWRSPIIFVNSFLNTKKWKKGFYIQPYDYLLTLALESTKPGFHMKITFIAHFLTIRSEAGFLLGKMIPPRVEASIVSLHCLLFCCSKQLYSFNIYLS